MGNLREKRYTLIKKKIDRGMVVVDVGANVGYYSLLASRLVGEDGKVFAFEPDPYNYALLIKNLRANVCKNVFPTRMAVLNRSGTMELFRDKQNYGAHSLFKAAVRNLHNSTLVKTVSLDEFFRGKERPIDIVKIDVQGSEVGVFEGMHKIIDVNEDLKIIMEFWPWALKRAGYSPMWFLKRILECNFKLYLIKEHIQLVDAEELIKICGETDSVNILCEKSHNSSFSRL